MFWLGFAIGFLSCLAIFIITATIAAMSFMGTWRKIFDRYDVR